MYENYIASKTQKVCYSPMVSYYTEMKYSFVYPSWTNSPLKSVTKEADINEKILRKLIVCLFFFQSSFTWVCLVVVTRFWFLISDRVLNSFLSCTECSKQAKLQSIKILIILLYALIFSIRFFYIFQANFYRNNMIE